MITQKLLVPLDARTPRPSNWRCWAHRACAWASERWPSAAARSSPCWSTWPTPAPRAPESTSRASSGPIATRPRPAALRTALSRLRQAVAAAAGVPAEALTLVRTGRDALGRDVIRWPARAPRA